MKSSSGAHYFALDHVRALAAFMVIAWHFTHAATGTPIPFQYTPDLPPLALLDEGHTGVALFMTLSGYLFAKLLQGKRIRYPLFLLNRILRVAPLLVLVIALVAVERGVGRANFGDYAREIARGAVFPTLPNGGWSITVEFHFYLLLPLLLWLSRRSKTLPIVLIALAVGVRTAILFLT